MGMRSVFISLALLAATHLGAASNEPLSATNAPAHAGASLDAARTALANALNTLPSTPARDSKETAVKPSSIRPEAAESTTNIVTPLPVLKLSRDALDDKIKLRAGDTVRYRVQEDKDETVRRTVTDGGELEIPYLGYVSAQGKTCKELATELKRMLEENYYYLATVNIAVESVLKKSVGRIWVYGKGVANPGPQELPPDEQWTVSKAVLRAGPTDFAKIKAVELYKGAGGDIVSGESVEKDKKITPIYVNVDEVQKNGRTSSDVAVEPNDVIIVKTLIINLGH